MVTHSNHNRQGRNKDVHFVIVTPTRGRRSLLRRFVAQVSTQSHPHWECRLTHDGPDRSFARWAAALRTHDARFIVEESERPGGDFGLSARRHALRKKAPARSYVLFWDDDNAFHPRALHDIAAALVAQGCPPVLLVPFAHRDRVLPPEIPLEALGLGEIDSACLVLESELARELLSEAPVRTGPVGYAFDYALWQGLRERNLLPTTVAAIASIGRYDGLKRYVRWGQRYPFLLRWGFWCSPRRLVAFARLRLTPGTGLRRAPSA